MRELCIQNNAWEFCDMEMKRLGIDYENKGVLALRVNLWFPYGDNISDVSVAYYKKNNPTSFFLEKIFVDRPYPNKRIAAAVTRINRRKSRRFIPIVFDSLEELYNIERLSIIWNIDNSEFVMADYNISFAKSEQKGIYCLFTYDEPFSTLSTAYDDAVFSIENNKILSGTTLSLYDCLRVSIIEKENKDAIVNVTNLAFGLDSSYLIDDANGFKLISELKERYPTDDRIILTCYHDDIVLHDNGVIP